MEKDGLISSRKGSMGGYRLNHSPQKITVGSIVYSLEGSTNITDCAHNGTKCLKTKTCEVFSIWTKVQKSLDDTLNSITLFSLIKKNEK